MKTITTITTQEVWTSLYAIPVGSEQFRRKRKHRHSIMLPLGCRHFFGHFFPRWIIILFVKKKKKKAANRMPFSAFTTATWVPNLTEGTARGIWKRDQKRTTPKWLQYQQQQSQRKEKKKKNKTSGELYLQTYVPRLFSPLQKSWSSLEKKKKWKECQHCQRMGVLHSSTCHSFTLNGERNCSLG